MGILYGPYNPISRPISKPAKNINSMITLNKTEIGVTSEIVDWISGNGTGDSGEAE